MEKLKDVRIHRSAFVLVLQIIFTQILVTLLYYGASTLLEFEQVIKRLPVPEVISYELVTLFVVLIIEVSVILLTYLAWSRDYYLLSVGRLVHMSGLYFHRSESITLQNVATVSYSQNPIGRLLKYGNVEIKKAGLDERTVIHSIPHPERFVKLITRYGQKSLQTDQAQVDVVELIRRGENTHVEFKSSLRWDYKMKQMNKSLELSLIKTLVGLLNSEGGQVVVGVDDRGKVLGLELDFQTLPKKNSDGFENHLSQIFRQSVGVAYRSFVQPRFYKVNDKDVCIMTVLPAENPVFVKHEGQEYFYVRTGNTTTSLSISEATDYIHKHAWQ